MKNRYAVRLSRIYLRPTVGCDTRPVREWSAPCLNMAPPVHTTVREITPTLGLRAMEAVRPEAKLGIQIGEPIGHTRPPRVYLFTDEFPNGGITAVVTKMFEDGGMSEAWEIPESSPQSVEDKAAECVKGSLDGFNPDDGGTLFLAGNEEMADEVLNRINIPDDISVKINEGEPEYIPDPTS